MSGVGAPVAAARQATLLIGTYTSGGTTSEGIYACSLDLVTGALSTPRLVGRAVDPSFLAPHPNGRWLYAVSETEQFEGQSGGGVAAFAFTDDGRLASLNQVPSEGVAPCHVSVHPSGRWLLVANYGGSVSVLPLLASGQLGPAVQSVRHDGSGANPERQAGPHPHSVQFGPDGVTAYVPDLGADRLVAYAFAAADGRLTARPDDVPVAAGAGPRHLAFHPSGLHAYVVNELDSTVTALRHDPASGRLSAPISLPTQPADFGGVNYPAEVRVHPSGRYVYVSNRGHDSIAVFAVHEVTGRLSPLGYQPTGGNYPRHFTLDVAGDWLVAANQASGTLTSFRVGADGGLRPSGHAVSVPAPACLLLL